MDNVTDHLIDINGIKRVHRETDQHVIAYFDVAIAAIIQIRGCALRRTIRGGLVISMPRMDADSARRGVDILDQSLRHAVMMRACEAYKGIGGTDLPLWALNPNTDRGVGIPIPQVVGETTSDEATHEAS